MSTRCNNVETRSLSFGPTENDSRLRSDGHWNGSSSFLAGPSNCLWFFRGYFGCPVYSHGVYDCVPISLFLIFQKESPHYRVRVLNHKNGQFRPFWVPLVRICHFGHHGRWALCLTYELSENLFELRAFVMSNLLRV